MKKKEPRNLWAYILRKNRSPYVWVASSFAFEDEVLRVMFKGSANYYGYSLRDPFTVVDNEGNVIFTVTEPSHIATITANMLTINPEENGSMTKQRFMEFVRELQQTPIDPKKTFEIYCSSDTIEQFNQELKKYTDEQP